MKLEVVYLRPVAGQGERVGHSIRGGACWEQQLVQLRRGQRSRDVDCKGQIQYIISLS